MIRLLLLALLFTGCGKLNFDPQKTGQAEFSPSSISGLQLWLRADQGVIASGTLVNSWTDSAGSMLFVAGANPPTYLAQSAEMNGQASVRFNFGGGTPQILVKSSVGFSAICGASPFTVASIIRPILSTVARYRYLIFNGAGSVNYFLASAFNFVPGEHIPGFLYRNNPNSLRGVISGSSGNTASAPMISIFRHLGPGDAVHLNGVESVTQDVNEGAPTFTETSCGTFNISVGISQLSNTPDGLIDIAEILIYDRAIGASEINALGCYARNKYGILNYSGTCN